MGSRSKSQTSSSTTNVQETTQASVGLENIEGPAIAGGGDVNAEITTTDFGAVQEGARTAQYAVRDSLDFAGEAVDITAELAQNTSRVLREGLDDSLDFGRDVSGQAFNVVRDVSGQALTEALDFGRAESDRAAGASESALRSLGQGIQTVGALSRSDTSESLNKIVLYIAIAVGIVGVAYTLSKRR